MSSELSKEETRFAKSLQGLRFLVADPSSGRKSIRKLLNHYRVKPNLIDVVENPTDAAEMIRHNKPHVVFADDTLNGIEAAMALRELQKEALGTEEPRVFFLMSTKDSRIMVSGAAEESVDAVLVKPFTFELLSKQFVQTLKNKLNPSPYVQSLEAGKALMEQGNFEAALDVFENAKQQDPKPALACAQMGLALQALGRVPEAIAAFQEGLRLHPTHFRSLLGLMDAYLSQGENEKAYATGRKLAEHHTIPLKRIPDLIRLSIVNHQFEDVLGFYEYADAVAKVETEASVFLGAGLVVCGLYFLNRRDQQAAIDAFRKADVVGQGRPKIQKRILVALVSAGMTAEVKAYLQRVPDEVKDAPEVKLAEFQRLALFEPPGRVIEAGKALLKAGTKLKEIHEVMIRKSVELNRSQIAMDELLYAAISDFPEEAAFFKGLMGRS